MLIYCFKSTDFHGLTIRVEARDRESAFNAVAVHVKRPSEWYLYHTIDPTVKTPTRVPARA